MVDALRQRYAGEHLSISLPSLRLDSFSVELADSLQGSRRSGLTFAPEAATPAMRRLINKPIPDEDLLAVAQAVFQRGWPTVKLYFMIGLPQETLDDVQAIVSLVQRVLAVGRAAIGGRAKVHVGVSTFVPKPHTPFQWAGLDEEANIRQKQALLRQALRSKAIRLTWNDPRESLLEAVLSRGDRRVGKAVLEAWRLGARFDAWQEHFRAELWEAAFQRAGLDPAFYAYRMRDVDEVLPWDHIDVGVRRAYLWREWQQALAGQVSPDCRAGCLGCGINIALEPLAEGANWLCPAVGVAASARQVAP